MSLTHLGLSAWAILHSKALKKGDTVVHNLKEGPLASAIATVAKELGVTLTSATETKNAQMAISDSAEGKLTKCLGPKGVFVACSGSAESSAVNASVTLSVTDAIFSDVSITGFDLGAWITTADSSTLAAGMSCHDFFHLPI